MPHLYRLPSGHWRAVVRMPGGRRTSKTDPLKTVVRQWAEDLEAEYRRGSRRDPRAGEVTVAEWHRKWLATRAVSAGHHEASEGRWRRHVEPHWARWRLADIRPSDVAAWIVQLRKGPLSAKSVRHCVSYLHTMLEAAVEDELIGRNPVSVRKDVLPPLPAPRRDFYTPAEVRRVVAAIDQRYALMVELAAYTGMRWAEVVGLTAGHVDVAMGLIFVRRVLERNGSQREYAKSSMSHRAVPVPPHLAGELAEWVDGMTPGELLFHSPDGKPVNYRNWRERVWLPAVAAAGLRDLGFHALRHSAASWLAMDGVDLHRIQQLLGHEDQRTSARYAHLAPDAHAAVTDTWQRLTAS